MSEVEIVVGFTWYVHQNGTLGLGFKFGTICQVGRLLSKAMLDGILKFALNLQSGIKVVLYFLIMVLRKSKYPIIT
jgi:hypothetical protein